MADLTALDDLIPRLLSCLEWHEPAGIPRVRVIDGQGDTFWLIMDTLKSLESPRNPEPQSKTEENRLCPVHGSKPVYGCAECERIHLAAPAPQTSNPMTVEQAAARGRDLATELQRYFVTDPPSPLTRTSDLYLLMREVLEGFAVETSGDLATRTEPLCSDGKPHEWRDEREEYGADRDGNRGQWFTRRSCAKCGDEPIRDEVLAALECLRGSGMRTAVDIVEDKIEQLKAENSKLLAETSKWAQMCTGRHGSQQACINVPYPSSPEKSETEPST